MIDWVLFYSLSTHRGIDRNTQGNKKLENIFVIHHFFVGETVIENGDVTGTADKAAGWTETSLVDQVGFHTVLHFRPILITPTCATAPAEETTATVTAFVTRMALNIVDRLTSSRDGLDSWKVIEQVMLVQNSEETDRDRNCSTSWNYLVVLGSTGQRVTIEWSCLSEHQSVVGWFAEERRDRCSRPPRHGSARKEERPLSRESSTSAWFNVSDMPEKEMPLVTRYSREDGEILLSLGTGASVLSDGVENSIGLFWSSDEKKPSIWSSELMFGMIVSYEWGFSAI